MPYSIHKVCTLDLPSSDKRSKDDACRSFQATRWSLIRRVCDDDSAVRRQALADLLRMYRPPMIRFLQSKGCSPADAEDIVHDFIEAKMLTGRFFEQADPSQGRLRTLLRVSLRNFMVDRWRQEKNRAQQVVDLEPQAANGADLHQRVFDREWAHQVLQGAYDSMIKYCVKHHRQDYLAIFNARIWNPTKDGAELPSYAQLKETGVIASVRQAQDALVNAKRLYKRCLIATVQETLSTKELLEEELKYLHQVLAAGQ